MSSLLFLYHSGYGKEIPGQLIIRQSMKLKISANFLQIDDTDKEND